MRMLTGLLLFTLATSAMAYTGNDYLETKENKSPWAQGFAEGHLVGVTDQYMMAGVAGMCPDVPEKLPVPQRIKIVEKYLEGHPEDTHYDVAGLVVLAFKDAFGTRPPNDNGFCW